MLSPLAEDNKRKVKENIALVLEKHTGVRVKCRTANVQEMQIVAHKGIYCVRNKVGSEEINCLYSWAKPQLKKLVCWHHALSTCDKNTSDYVFWASLRPQRQRQSHVWCDWSPYRKHTQQNPCLISSSANRTVAEANAGYIFKCERRTAAHFSTVRYNNCKVAAVW